MRRRAIKREKEIPSSFCRLGKVVDGVGRFVLRLLHGKNDWRYILVVVRLTLFL